MINHANTKHKKADVAILRPDKVEHKTGNTIRALLNDKVANYQKDLIPGNVYVRRNRASNYVKQKLTELEEEIEKNQNVSWEFNS